MLKKIILTAAAAIVFTAAVLLAVFADVEESRPKTSLFPDSVSVYITESSRIEQISYDKFVEGCLCGIIPNTGNIYDEQTLAAAAVVINTNALIALENKSALKDLGADFAVCDELPYVSYTDKAVNHADRKFIQSAVKTARHAYLAYKGKPAAVKMCAVSSGKTRELPFMPSKDLPEDALAKGYLTERAFTESEVLNAFSSLNLAGKSPAEWFSDPVYDETGELVSIDFLGRKLSGAEIRSALKLKSAAISVDYSLETFYFRCKGNGDNAGMSLNAANIAAQSGKTFDEILAKFYTLELVVEEQALPA